MPPRLTVLLVEDDADDAMIFQLAVRKLKPTVYCVSHGQEAIDYIEGGGDYADCSTHPFPDVIFLDWRLPIMSGREFLEWCRQTPAFESMVVVALIGSEAEQDFHEAAAAGANVVLAKQASIQKYSDRLNEILSTIAERRSGCCGVASR